jgi:hypothetical protein
MAPEGCLGFDKVYLANLKNGCLMTINKLFHRYPAEIFLFLASLFIRFPFFFRDYIDRDESTFILMGQSIADGYLPYDRLWDLKPPLLFYLFAVIEKVFPHSFVAIRFFGVIVIFLSAILLMRIAKQADLKNGFLIAVGYVVLSSEFGSLQGVMSEHLAVFFLLLGLLFFLRKRNYLDFAVAGFAFGCAILCKLNYAYAIALFFLFYLVNEYRNGNLRHAIAPFLVMAVSFLLPVVLMAIPFLMQGKTGLFVNSVFLAPLKYASASDLTWAEKLKTTWWLLLVTAFICYIAARFSRRENRPVVTACILILVATVYTFFSSGIVNGHYLVQVYPFFLILLLGVLPQRTVQPKLSVVALVVVLLSFESIMEGVRLIQSRKEPAEYRPTFEVVSELRKLKLDNDKIFFTDYHIGYWLLHQYPLTKSTTHPSNLARPFLFRYYNDSNNTSLQELRHILDDLKPQVIVSSTDGIDFLPDSSSENKYFLKQMGEHFHVVYKDEKDRIYIWERDSNK